MDIEYPAQGTITQFFDTPVDYIAGRTKHEALDIVNDTFVPVHAMFSGIVVLVVDDVPDYEEWSATNTTGYGNEVWVSSYNGRVKMRVAHLKQDIPVSEGQEVEAKQKIATMGQTGFRFPPPTIHTHYEIYVDGVRIDPLDTDTWEAALDESLTINDMTSLEQRVAKLEAQVERLKNTRKNTKRLRKFALTTNEKLAKKLGIKKPKKK